MLSYVHGDGLDLNESAMDFSYVCWFLKYFLGLFMHFLFSYMWNYV